MDSATWLYAIGGIAVLALVVAIRALSKASGGAPEEEAAPARPAPASAPEGQLVAVIAAAVAASSGMAPGSFRIASFEAAPGMAGGGGFNTPVWGHVDRLVRASRIR